MESTLTGYRLSPQQRRLFHRQVAGRANSSSVVLNIDGALSSDALCTACNRIVERHEILRTRYHRPPGRKLPFQIIASDGTQDWAEHDFRRLPAEPRKAEIARLLAENEQRAFDPDDDPTLRCTLLRLTDRSSLVQIVVPASSADIRSLQNLVSELAYHISGNEPDLARIEPLQYLQYSEWQNDLLEAEAEAAATAYLDRCRWQPDVLAVTDSAESSIDAPCRITLELSTELTQRLRQFAGDDARLEDLLLAGWIALLERRKSGSSAALGIYCHGRPFEELNDALGVMAKYLPISVGEVSTVGIADLMRATEAACADANDNQPYIDPEILTAPSGETRIFPYGFSYSEYAPLQPVGDLHFTLLSAHAPIERFYLNLDIHNTQEAINAQLHFDPNHVSLQAVQRIAQQFPTLLNDALNNPHKPVQHLDILPDTQRHELLIDFNANDFDFEPVGVVQRFEHHAHANLHAIALQVENHSLTYQQLNERANQLARCIRDKGIRPDTPVALLLDRSLNSIVALLAALKAGAAYLPLDPAYPKERMRFLLKDSHTPLLITTSDLLQELGGFEGETLCLDREGEMLAGLSQQDLPPLANLDHLAYVIYTSGSTGEPKGVMVEHRGLAHYTQALLQRLDLHEGAHFASVSTLAADLGNTVVFGALCSGGCLHLIASDTLLDAQALGEYLHTHPIDCLKIVPSHLGALLNADASGRVLPKQRLVLGGEVCSWSLVEKVHSLRPECVVFNHYGPTETTVGVLTHRVGAGEEEEPKRRGRSVPLGRGLGSTRVYVLDAHRRLVPVGVVGELYVGGPQVSRGYVGREALTKDRFVLNPFEADAHGCGSGALLYRTGDLVVWLESGELEFVGRVDDQVKVRGYRVELGEIESVLRVHAGIREACVLALGSGIGDRRLVGCVVGDAGAVLDSEGLREHVLLRLPEWMVPVEWVWLDALPLTGNGKVDRQRLMGIAESADRGIGGSYVGASSAVEEVLCGIWGELLGVERVGVHDNFFVLGGHSLLATQVVSRIRSALGLPAVMRMIFEFPTVSELARAMEALRGADADATVPPVVKVDRAGELPLSFAQQRLWFIDQLEQGSYLYNVPVALRLRGALDVQALRSALSTLVSRHEILRTTFANIDGKPSQVINEPRGSDLPIIDLAALTPHERSGEAERLTMEEAQRPFDLASGPLLRTSLLRLAEHEHILLLTLHHIVSDGWSKSVLFREAGALYADFCSGRAPSLADLPIQYADFAAWQHSWFDGRVEAQQIAFWKAQLAGAPTLLELPSDRPRSAEQDYQGGWLPFQVPNETFECLKQISREEEASLFMTLLAAFTVLLWRYTGQEDLLVGTDVANRNQEEFEGLIGFLLNHIVLRTRIRPAASFRDLLRAVRETALNAYSHQDLPFEKLVEALSPERNPGHTPLFQVLFVHQNLPMATLSLSGLQVEPVPVLYEATKFDMGLFIRDDNGLTGAFQFRKALFDTETIERMRDRFTAMLAAISADPDLQVDRILLETEQEREQLRLAEEQSRQAQGRRIRTARRAAE